MATEQEEIEKAAEKYTYDSTAFEKEKLKESFIAGWEECMKFYGISKVPDQYDDERYVDENPR